MTRVRSPRLEVTLVGRAAEDDVEARGEFADLRILHRLEVGRHEFAVDRVAQLAVDAVAQVPRVAVDEQLAGEQVPAALLNLEVDVRRRPAGVRDRLDGAGEVLAAGAGREPAEAL